MTDTHEQNASTEFAVILLIKFGYYIDTFPSLYHCLNHWTHISALCYVFRRFIPFLLIPFSFPFSSVSICICLKNFVFPSFIHFLPFSIFSLFIFFYLSSSLWLPSCLSLFPFCSFLVLISYPYVGTRVFYSIQSWGLLNCYVLIKKTRILEARTIYLTTSCVSNKNFNMLFSQRYL